MTEEEYRAALAEKGYPDPVEKAWAPGHVNEDHTHDKALFLRIAAGRMTVTLDGTDHVLDPGDTIEVAAEARHTETVGLAGVRFLVAAK